MTKKHCIKLLSVLFFVLSEPANAKAPERIQSVILDRGKVARIYIAPGLGSVLTLPCNVAEAFVGREAEVTVIFSPNSKRVLFISLNSGSSEPTNVVLRCERGRVNLVFDIIPSKFMHQDVVEVRSSFGSPELTGANLNLMDSSETRKTTQKIRESSSKTARQIATIEKPAIAKSKSAKDKP